MLTTVLSLLSSSSYFPIDPSKNGLRVPLPVNFIMDVLYLFFYHCFAGHPQLVHGSVLRYLNIYRGLGKLCLL